jgi:hypothetical protein
VLRRLEAERAQDVRRACSARRSSVGWNANRPPPGNRFYCCRRISPRRGGSGIGRRRKRNPRIVLGLVAVGSGRARLRAVIASPVLTPTRPHPSRMHRLRADLPNKEGIRHRNRAQIARRARLARIGEAFAVSGKRTRRPRGDVRSPTSLSHTDVADSTRRGQRPRFLYTSFSSPLDPTRVTH